MYGNWNNATGLKKKKKGSNTDNKIFKEMYYSVYYEC